ncbi:hypothetical protein COO60DRAFT_1124347 [Scenedesmus sp. NREL 46B-D3]|nr:hypothetical protein COO60DRAFT_1124347 [Scenedesmus sp. NREL 46B-D3]
MPAAWIALCCPAVVVKVFGYKGRSLLRTILGVPHQRHAIALNSRHPLSQPGIISRYNRFGPLPIANNDQLTVQDNNHNTM